MKIQGRPHRASQIRPEPEFQLDAETNLLLIVTPWGPRSVARKTLSIISESYAVAKGDSDATTPYARLSCLSNEANSLRAAVLLANDTLHREENKEEFKCGVELFAASFIDNEFVWVQVGQPHVLLSRKNGLLLPLGSCVDLSVDLSSGETMLPALPNQMLGVDSSLNLNMNSFRVQPGDRLIFLSHSAPPHVLYNTATENLNLDELTRRLASAAPNTAFWIGILEFPDVETASREAKEQTLSGISA